ncbi:GNAT family N-acetyltransferase [Streptomyces sp. NPDC087300]|uniref:GNAT family N-acetyltransferase n=1 Tax=Streptomyces sp. NPDC087300 TaxID=3365780 RepID=UPI003800495C
MSRPGVTRISGVTSITGVASAPGGPDSPGRPRAFTTARLTLRPIERADVPAVSRLWTDPDVRRHLGGPVADDVVRERERACVGAPGALSVVRTRDSVVLGLVSVEPGARQGRTEVSYQLLPEHWGHGYAREAVGAVVGRLMAPPEGAEVPGIVAVTQEANSRSRRLLEALGARVEERFVEWDERQVLYAFAALIPGAGPATGGGSAGNPEGPHGNPEGPQGG